MGTRPAGELLVGPAAINWSPASRAAGTRSEVTDLVILPNGWISYRLRGKAMYSPPHVIDDIVEPINAPRRA